MDTLGLLLKGIVHAANLQDRDGAKLVLTAMQEGFPRLELIWADGSYRGDLEDWVVANTPCRLEIVQRPAEQVGFQVLPRRWVVERTFGGLGRYRRLSKEYEALPETSEALIYVAMIRLMVRRLATG